MVAMIHDVEGRRDQAGWANLDDFDLGPGAEVALRLVIDQPNWSLYGLDHARDLAVFVDLPAATDLADSPFAFATQHRLARRVLVMSLAELETVADLAPPVGRVILIFSIGRCGSTLLSHALNNLPGVWCLSEPDAYSTLVMQNYHSRRRSGFRRDQVVRLIRACTRLQFRPPAGRSADVFAVKFRSQALFQADLYHAALPDASFVFLYRDALGWANSVYGMLRQYGSPDPLTGADRTLAWSIFTAAADPARLGAFVDLDAPEAPLELALAPAWACNMAEYTRHLQGGVPFCALRYTEFNRDREASLTRMLRHCRLPTGSVAKALAAFEADSQAGTHLARDVTTERLSVERLARLREILAQDSDFGDPDRRVADIYAGG